MAGSLLRPIFRWGGVAVAMLSFALMVLGSVAARAGVSAEDGYTLDGSPQIHVELTPYLWLPAANGTIKLGSGAQRNISQGIPTISDISASLRGAFLGYGLVRYGPWSGEIDIDYVSASVGKNFGPGFLATARELRVKESLIQVQPGFGYEVFKGDLGGIPATLDARTGFSWFESDTSVNLNLTGPEGAQHKIGVSDDGSFVQPWAGLRGAIYPWPRWRFEIMALGNGFGVGGGVWGWGATATATWAANDWLNLAVGFRALNTSRNSDSSRGVRSATITAYGPVLGVGFSF